MEYIWAAVLAGKILAGGVVSVDNMAQCVRMQQANQTFYQAVDPRIRVRHECRFLSNACEPGMTCRLPD